MGLSIISRLVQRKISMNTPRFLYKLDVRLRKKLIPEMDLACKNTKIQVSMTCITLIMIVSPYYT